MSDNIRLVLYIAAAVAIVVIIAWYFITSSKRRAEATVAKAREWEQYRADVAAWHAAHPGERPTPPAP